ncbi:MAG: HYR domain-containing protein [Nitrosopumilus sp.]|uniref:HYR domain-containing protein n=1 Tax=Nitrosopumilus sp. TaxID=2024843 RepID=UPI00242B31F4|nr:HYR domain-containing protein [Nitrosopumilus sp.]MCV0367682.1 HYR domain-containing protein [Nitrosopumilus sp.]
MHTSGTQGQIIFLIISMISFAVFLTESDQVYGQANPVDQLPPIFDSVTDIFVEATSINGAIVDYDIPNASDNVEVISVTCDPSPNSTFSLGQTVVSCIAIDGSNNQASRTFSVFVEDNTPPEISVNNLEFNAVGLFTPIELEFPTIIDAVDSSPAVSNNAPELFPLGITEVTWRAEDSEGNSATKIQLITLSISSPTIQGPSEIVLEATAFETPTSDIEFGIVVNSALEYELSNNSTESFQLGATQISWTLIDVVENIANLIQTITLVDTTPPEIELELKAHTLNKERDEGTFSVFYDVRDKVDFSPITKATINDVEITNNQFVNLKLDSSESGVKEKQGILEFTGTEFILKVISTDFSGNENTLSTTATFQTTPPIIDIPIQEIPITELTFDDLQEFLDKLKTTPPSDLDNLGQELKQLKFIANLLFDQENNNIKNLKKELKQQIKETDGDTKELKKEYNDIIKQARSDFKSLQDQYKEIFAEYKTTTKLMLKEKKGFKIYKLENDLKEIENDFIKNEAKRNEKIDLEKNQKQKAQDERTDELYNMLITRISQNNMPHEQVVYNSIQKLVTDDFTSKEKQKLIHVILKNSDKSTKEEFTDAKKELKKNDKELKKSLKLQEKELKKIEKELKKIEKEQEKLSKLQEKELKKIEKELKKIEKEQEKQLKKEQNDQNKIEKELAEKSEKLEKQLKKDTKEAEKEAKKAEKEAKKAEKEAKKAEKEAKKKK